MPMKLRCAQYRPTCSTGVQLGKNQLPAARSGNAEGHPFPGTHWRPSQSSVWHPRNPYGVPGTPESARTDLW